MALDNIRLEKSRALLEVCVIPDQHYTASIAKALPRRPQLIPLLNAKKVLPLDSPLRTSELINSHDVILSEFDNSKRNDEQFRLKMSL